MQLGQEDLDADLRHSDHRMGIQDVAQPVRAAALEHGSPDRALLQHDIALHRGGRGVFAVLHQAVRACRAFAQHLEDDHGVSQQRAAAWDRAAGHDSDGVADAVHHLDVEAVAVPRHGVPARRLASAGIRLLAEATKPHITFSPQNSVPFL